MIQNRSSILQGAFTHIITLDGLSQLQVCTCGDCGFPPFTRKKKKDHLSSLCFWNQPHAYPHDDWTLNSWEMSVLENLQPSQLETINRHQGNSAVFDSTLLLSSASWVHLVLSF